MVKVSQIFKINYTKKQICKGFLLLQFFHEHSIQTLGASIIICLSFLDSCVMCEAGQKVMVVGGGLTSAHVISIALQQGASHVMWVMRKHLQVQLQSSWRPALSPSAFTEHISLVPSVKTVRRGWCGESGGSLLPCGAWHQDGWPSLSAAIL